MKNHLFQWMRAHPYDDLVVLDVTASEQLADQYLDFASHGFHVISANKVAGASNSQKYREIRNAFTKTGRHWLYNATVGAGLPVNHTVRDLRESGDSILAISGIFSGTLSWLFLQFDGTVPFTELVDQAWQQGLTEPDPRVDLSGKDVMRKLVILAREAGYDIEPDQVRVESLVTNGSETGSIDHFFENGDEMNEQMLQRFEAAQEMGWFCVMSRVSMRTVKRVSVWKLCALSILWLHCCRATTCLPSKAVGIAITRWLFVGQVPGVMSQPVLFSRISIAWRSCCKRR